MKTMLSSTGCHVRTDFMKPNDSKLICQPGKLDPKLIIFILIFSLSGFGRFVGDFLESEIQYPAIFVILIDWNRAILAALMSALLLPMVVRLKLPKLYAQFYWAPIAFHFFLAVKLLLDGNPLWYMNFFGSLILISMLLVFSQANRQINTIFVLEKIIAYIVMIWIVSVGIMYLLGGVDIIQFGSRYFFFSSHANHAGSLWAFASLSTLFFLMFGEKLYLNLKVATFIVCVVFLVLTGSRGAMLSLVIGVFVLFASAGGKKSHLLLVLALLSILAIAYFGNDYIAEQISRGNTREGTYDEALNDFFNYPIFGAPIPTGRTLYVENTFLAFMQLGGMFGAVCGLIFYIGAVGLIVRSFKKLKNNKGSVPHYFFVIMVTMLCASLFESYPLNYISLGSFAIMFSLTYLLKYVQVEL